MCFQPLDATSRAPQTNPKDGMQGLDGTACRTHIGFHRRSQKLDSSRLRRAFEAFQHDRPCLLALAP